jgi:Acetyltransferase (GNAT) domain
LELLLLKNMSLVDKDSLAASQMPGPAMGHPPAVWPVHEPAPAAAPQPRSAGALTAERYSPDRKAEWDGFVHEGRNATFLFYRDYMDYHGDRFTDHSMMVFQGQTLVAILPANLGADGTLVSHEGLTYGGLVLARAARLGNALACFHALLQDLVRRRILRLRYKRMPGCYHTFTEDDLEYALFLLDARLYRRDCSAALSLVERPPLIRERKSLIRKAADHGVRIVRETSFQAFWERVLVPQLESRHGAKPVHTLDEITLLARRFPEHIKQVSAYLGDEIVAGATIYETSTVARAQYGAVTENGRHCGAQAFLFDWLIEQYKDKRFFDFGTSNQKEGRGLNQSLLDWKEGFGARCYTQDYYEIATGNYPGLEPMMPARR